ncbi:MAG: amidohydrolase family protein, partial [Deltaproteobacteria bacterium]|nr:amidohydrolase family protein [Deltaproteobacteria bacterium]
MPGIPVDAHCHLFSAKYAVEEAAAMGWAYVSGNYPHAEAAFRALPEAERWFSWSGLENVVQWFFDLGAAVSDYETNLRSLKTACRRGLNRSSAEELIVAPLMMDIFYMFGPPASGPVPAIRAVRAGRARKDARTEKDREASEAAYESFKRRLIVLAEGKTAPKAGRRPPGPRASLKVRRAEGLQAGEIERIFEEERAEAPIMAGLKGAEAGREISRGFRNQIEALLRLGENHRGSVFPFFAVDPRRRGSVDMAVKGIPEFNGGKALVTPKGPFFGIKLYTRLGYLPEDVPDDLYRYCCDSDIPIIVHTSTGGFPPGSDWAYAGDAAPLHWERVLEKHPSLRLDFAHFGNGDSGWVRQILDLMSRYP